MGNLHSAAVEMTKGRVALPFSIHEWQGERSFRVICTPNPMFSTAHKPVILSGAPRRPIANGWLVARSRRTPAMIAGRCSSKLSSRMTKEEGMFSFSIR